MKIKKRLNLNTVIFLGAVALMALSLAWSYHVISKAKRNLDLVEELRNVSFERTMLRDDYLLHGEERAKIQWHAKTEDIRRLLDIADQRFTDDNDRDLLRKARRDFDVTLISFSDFMDRHKGVEPGSTKDFNLTETESILISHVFLKAYSLRDNINKLQVTTNRELIRVRERSTVIVAFFMFAGIIVIVANSMILNRLLNKRIAALGKGIEIVGAGDLDYRIDAQGDDELSDLARGCNEMAGKLKMSYTSVENLRQEITERKRAEEALRVILDSTDDGILAVDASGKVIFYNKRFLELWRIPQALADSSDDNALLGFVLEQLVDPEGYLRKVERLYGTADIDNDTIPFKDGRFFERYSMPMMDSGCVRGRLWSFHDITDRKRGGQEKDKLQAQLLQAMKMEAIGRLAGGVAHDFNNLLTVITGYSDLLLQKVGKESPMRGDVEEIRRAGERATLLTQQLLAFSRKQIIDPKVVRLDALVAEVQAMLARLIGEDIALQTATGEALGSVKVDPGQFQQILMNLAVNARDAMPGGGKIVIETANVDLDEGYRALHPYVTPGRFVMLAVSDTGMGMSEEVKTHIFEPFYTTKERGSGTGLGLATTYGAVKQAGGSIEVYSEVGIGTTIKIYLPRVDEEAMASVKDDRPTVLPGGTETVLLVEDEDMVRNVCVRILERLGYKVLRASNGAEAIAMAQGDGDRIDLLLTDVVMPGMNGSVLAAQLILHHPEMKVLFTSGYTDDAIVRHGVLEEGVSFIGKPYTPLALAGKVREVLDKA